MSNSKNEENKTKRQRKDVKNILQFEFIALLVKHFGHFLLILENFRRKVLSLAELEGISKQSALTKGSDKVTARCKSL